MVVLDQRQRIVGAQQLRPAGVGAARVETVSGQPGVLQRGGQLARRDHHSAAGPQRLLERVELPLDGSCLLSWPVRCGQCWWLG
jgi:hypothetical protein